MSEQPPRLPERIEAAPLVIRRWLRTDAKALTALLRASLDHLRPWMAWAADEPLSGADRLRQIETWDRYWATGRGAVYGVFVGDDPIGGCALHRRVGPGGLDVGYWLCPPHLAKGWATTIGASLTAAGCADPTVSFIQISHEARNVRSGAVPRRLGYEQVSSVGGVTTWRHQCEARPSGT